MRPKKLETDNMNYVINHCYKHKPPKILVSKSKSFSVENALLKVQRYIGTLLFSVNFDRLSCQQIVAFFLTMCFVIFHVKRLSMFEVTYRIGTKKCSPVEATGENWHDFDTITFEPLISCSIF